MENQNESSMFRIKNKSNRDHDSDTETSNNDADVAPEVISVKDFFDFMKIAYQVYEHLGGGEKDSKVDWEELTKLTVLNHVIEQKERDLLSQTTSGMPKASVSKSESAVELPNCEVERIKKICSTSDLEGKNGRQLVTEAKIEMLSAWTEANLNCKLNDVFNEGILDSILPYLVGYKKPMKTTSDYSPIIKKISPTSTQVAKPASFGAFCKEKESRDRLGRRRSFVATAQEKLKLCLKQDCEVEIHVCDEVKGLKKDFICPQKLLVSKMGYFADVTAGQRLEDMDISVHCDIQIFDWLMRWVKRDCILVADWPLLDPSNVVPILVSASFLQMEPLLHDCLIYCHAHMTEIVKTSTNLSCLSDALLTRLAAMYTNAELEAVRDRKDKIQSKLYCKMIISLCEVEPETLRGHHATLATLFKCTKCNKLLGYQIAKQVPCNPTNMHIDTRGNVISSHTKDPTWSLNEYISWLYGELRTWRRVYWRLWADCHFLHCQYCDTYFPVYQMEWCSHHAQSPHMFVLEGRLPLPAGRYPCCGERAYRFETITRNTGCLFREHLALERHPGDTAALELYSHFRDIIAMRPPQLSYPERLTRLVPREMGEDNSGRLTCKEVFWWDGIQIVPPRRPFGLLGKLYTSSNKFNPNAQPDSPLNQSLGQATLTLFDRPSISNTQGGTTSTVTVAEQAARPDGRSDARPEKGKVTGDAKTVSGLELVPADAGSEHSSSDESERSCGSRSDEDAPTKNQNRQGRHIKHSKTRVVGRQWMVSLSARSNQDGQRRYEERCVRQMRLALARRAQPANRHRVPPGGVYARLEAEWRERHGQRARSANAVRARTTKTK